MPRLYNFFTPSVSLTEAQTVRLNAWQTIPRGAAPHPLQRSRFVVVDVETSGLNLAKDKLIAIGAVAIVDGQIALHDSFEMVLQQASSSSKQNILIHGIGGEIQIEGQAPAEVLLAFLQYLQKDPLIAFHVTFDETMLCRAITQYLGFTFKHDWLDLAYVAPVLYPQQAQQLHSLDDWLRQFQIHNYARHNALADAVSTAQLFLLSSRAAVQKNISCFEDLRHIEKNQRWLK